MKIKYTVRYEGSPGILHELTGYITERGDNTLTIEVPTAIVGVLKSVEIPYANIFEIVHVVEHDQKRHYQPEPNDIITGFYTNLMRPTRFRDL